MGHFVQFVFFANGLHSNKLMIELQIERNAIQYILRREIMNKNLFKKFGPELQAETGNKKIS